MRVRLVLLFVTFALQIRVKYGLLNRGKTYFFAGNYADGISIDFAIEFHTSARIYVRISVFVLVYRLYINYNIFIRKYMLGEQRE